MNTMRIPTSEQRGHLLTTCNACKIQNGRQGPKNGERGLERCLQGIFIISTKLVQFYMPISPLKTPYVGAGKIITIVVIERYFSFNGRIIYHSQCDKGITQES